MHSRGAVAFVIASVTWLAGQAIAETYPTRTIRLIVPYAPGGATDVVGRRVGQRLSEVVGQSVVVENRPGGMENIGVRACTDAAPDGYTLCLPTQQSIVYNGLTMRQMPFDPNRELVPIINLYLSMSVVAINSEHGVRSIDELIRFAKTRRGALNYGAFSYPLEYFIEKLNKENGIDLVKVPFRSGTELANAHAGELDPDWRSGRLQHRVVSGERPRDRTGGQQQRADGGISGYTDRQRAAAGREISAVLVRALCAGRNAARDRGKDRRRHRKDSRYARLRRQDLPTCRPEAG